MDKTSPYYFDFERPYCQWWLAITSTQISYNRNWFDYHRPGMIRDDMDPQQQILEVGEAWNFTDRKGLHQAIYSLATAQTHGNIWQDELARRACSSAQSWQRRIESTDDPVARGEMHYLDTIYRHVGIAGFRGWDYSRGSFLVRSGYAADWVTAEEFAFLLNFLARQIQYHFNNWSHYLQSFIYGRTYWQYLVDEDPDEQNLPYLLNNGFGLGVSRFFQQIENDPDCPIPSLPWDIPLPQLTIPDSLNTLLNQDAGQEDETQ
jgi:hypothetical protein